jgi:beta-aspartyl-dipeptidase (metallo-type)
MGPFTLLVDGRVHCPRELSTSSLEPTDLLVGGGRILQTGDLRDLARGPLGPALTVIDLEGRSVVPGLVDAHVHLCGGGGEGGFRTRVPRVDLAALVGSGVTSVVGLLGTDAATRTMRDLVASAYALREEGLSAWCYTGNYHIPVQTLTGSVKDDVVFIDPVLGVGELALSDHRSSQPTFEELLRVASEAYVGGLTAGKPGIMHLHMGDGARGLELVRRALVETELPARIWQPTHLNRNRSLWAEAKALAQTPLPPLFDVTAFPADDDPDTLLASAAVLDWLASDLPLGRLSVSSDGGGCLPVFEEGRLVRMGVGSSDTLLQTVRELVSAGLTLREAVSPMTLHPARALGLVNKGWLGAGADADLVVLGDEARPWLVMASGRVMWEGGRLTAAGQGTFGPPSAGGNSQKAWRSQAARESEGGNAATEESR